MPMYDLLTSIVISFIYVIGGRSVDGSPNSKQVSPSIDTCNTIKVRCAGS